MYASLRLFQTVFRTFFFLLPTKHRHCTILSGFYMAPILFKIHFSEQTNAKSMKFTPLMPALSTL